MFLRVGSILLPTKKGTSHRHIIQRFQYSLLYTFQGLKHFNKRTSRGFVFGMPRKSRFPRQNSYLAPLAALCPDPGQLLGQ